MAVPIWAVGNDCVHGLLINIFNERMSLDIPKTSTKFDAKRSTPIRSYMTHTAPSTISILSEGTSYYYLCGNGRPANGAGVWFQKPLASAAAEISLP